MGAINGFGAGDGSPARSDSQPGRYTQHARTLACLSRALRLLYYQTHKPRLAARLSYWSG